ncbi:hypothetical protein Tco_0887388 [Tanacetum coccineum]
MLLAQGLSDGIDTFDSDCDEVPVAQATFMDNLLSYDSDVLSEVSNYNTYHDNTVLEQNVQEMQYSEQPVIDDYSNIEITNKKYFEIEKDLFNENDRLLVAHSFIKIVKSSTKASRSMTKNDTRNNEIQQPSSSNLKDQKVEAHPRNVQSSPNKKNHASKSVCSTCKKCLVDENHDMCMVDYLNDVNVRVRNMSVKSVKKEWKLTSKVFTNVGHKWGSRGSNLYTISLEEMLKSSPICLLSKASKKPIPDVDDFSSNTVAAYSTTERLSFGKISRPAPRIMTPGYVISGLVQNPSSSTPNVPPSKKD